MSVSGGLANFMMRNPKTIFKTINWAPVFRTAGIRVTRVSEDRRELDVELRKHWWNQNMMGTQMGGLIYSMIDPWYMIMMTHSVGRKYVVWDKAATIRFVSPGVGTVHANFRLTEEQIQQAKEEADREGRSQPTFMVQVKDSSGKVVAEVEKVISVRRKDKIQSRTATTQSTADLIRPVVTRHPSEMKPRSGPKQGIMVTQSAVLTGMTKTNPKLLFKLVNLWPPYFVAGVRATPVGSDLREINVRMKMTFWNKNVVSTHFGGSIYSMVDPWYVLMLMHNLGKDYIVWDKEATIRFRTPGVGTISAKLQVSQEVIDQVREEADRLGKSEAKFCVEILDTAGKLVADVDKVISVRRKDRTKN